MVLHHNLGYNFEKVIKSRPNEYAIAIWLNHQLNWLWDEETDLSYSPY